jgi:rhamnulokinase
MAGYIAFDLGASSGRAVLGEICDGHLELEEIHRFGNRPVWLRGNLYWDILAIYREILEALSKVAARGKRVRSIGIDTWGVDFGLIAKDGSLIGNPFAYRDPRTEGAPERVFRKLSWERLYEITGIQLMTLNSLFQLYVMVEAGHPWLKIADRLLFLPDLLNYFLTGQAVSEITIASTSQMLDARKRQWSDEICNALGLPRHILTELIPSGHILGPLSQEVSRETGLKAERVVATAGHDTACAVAAVPASGADWAYLSSGTWSLMGVELPEPLISPEARELNFTNEAGVYGSIRFLKNISGLWLLQECRRIWGDRHSYEELVSLAERAQPFRCFVYPDHPSFLAPGDMPEAIRRFCRETGQDPPEDEGAFTRCILESLALRYRTVFDSIGKLLGRRPARLHVVGGGSKNRLLNQFTADALNVTVLAGPSEATACGNILVQAIADGELKGIEEGRELLRRSMQLVVYEPREPASWQEAYERYRAIERKYEAAGSG